MEVDFKYTVGKRIENNQEEDYNQFNKELNLKQRCQSDPNLSIRQIFEEECGSTSDANFDRLKSTMLHHRKKALPKNPTSIEETDNYLKNETVRSLITVYATWLAYEYVKRDEYSYLLFESKKILNRLPENRVFNVTCTMRVVPAGYFKVLMTISLVVKTTAFPCIFTLMSNRSESAYDDVLRKIEEKWNLRLTKVYIDFKRALRSAVCNLYPAISTNCHWYQYVMAVRLKGKKIDGFYERSYEDEGVANFCFDWSVHGSQCSTNYNDNLKKRFCNPESKCSFLSFIRLLGKETEKITTDFETSLATDVEKKFSKTRRVALFEKEYHSLVNGSIDIQMFFKRLTFVDNNGHVEYMNNYTIGDENEIDLLNDEDRNGMIALNSIEPQVVQQLEEVQEDTNPDMMCVICLDRPKNTILFPCRHLKFCQECIDILSEPQVDEDGLAITPKCPVCRVVYTEVVHPYLWFVLLPKGVHKLCHESRARVVQKSLFSCDILHE